MSKGANFEFLLFKWLFLPSKGLLGFGCDPTTNPFSYLHLSLVGMKLASCAKWQDDNNPKKLRSSNL
jgi:hypothetical protein